jgi:diacylglycerol kinase (ATP)
MRRLLVIYNPTAGRRARRRFDKWRQCLSLDASVTVYETTAQGDAEALARAADPARYDAVAVAGGDGTINEAVNGLSESSLPLAIFPLGTANVLAAELGLPKDIVKLAQIAAFAEAHSVWPGEAVKGNSVWRFLIMAGVGFDADVVEHVDLELKRRIGRLAYGASILGRLYDYQPRRYRALVDGEPIEAASLVVAKGHYYGGRFVLAPAARLSEPMFQVVPFPQSSRRAACGYLAAMVLGKAPPALPARQVELLEPVGGAVQIDGDVRLRLPVALRIAATPLHLIHLQGRPR